MNNRTRSLLLPLGLLGALIMLSMATVSMLTRRSNEAANPNSDIVVYETEPASYSTDATTSFRGGTVPAPQPQVTTAPQAPVTSQPGLVIPSAAPVQTTPAPPATAPTTTVPPTAPPVQVPSANGTQPTTSPQSTAPQPTAVPQTAPSYQQSPAIAPRSAQPIPANYQPFAVTTCDGLAAGANFRTTPTLNPNTILGVIPSGRTVYLTGQQTESDGVFWRQAFNPDPLAASAEPSAQNRTAPNQTGWVADCFVATR